MLSYYSEIHYTHPLIHVMEFSQIWRLCENEIPTTSMSCKKQTC